MPLLKQFVCVFAQKFKILFFTKPFSQFLSFGVKETGVHLARHMSFYFVRVAEISPLVEKINGDNVVDGMV